MAEESSSTPASEAVPPPEDSAYSEAWPEATPETCSSTNVSCLHVLHWTFSCDRATKIVYTFYPYSRNPACDRDLSAIRTCPNDGRPCTGCCWSWTSTCHHGGRALRIGPCHRRGSHRGRDRCGCSDGDPCPCCVCFRTDRASCSDRCGASPGFAFSPLKNSPAWTPIGDPAKAMEPSGPLWRRHRCYSRAASTNHDDFWTPTFSSIPMSFSSCAGSWSDVRGGAGG